MKVIGIDIGGTIINSAIISENKFEKAIHEKINAKGTREEILNHLTHVIDRLIDKDVKAIGIGTPGIIDTEKGIISEINNIPSFREIPLKQILEKKYKIPVIIDNDANCFALSNKYFGKAKPYQNIIALILGTGLGAGVIINNKLYHGNSGNAGEFGSIIFKEHNIEYYCSGQYFQKEFNISGEELFKKAEEKDKKALEIFDKFGYNLGKALSIIVNSIDPEIIILGGSVSKAYKFFEKSMIKSLKESIFERSYSKLKIEVSNIEHIAILGAASLYYDSLTNKK